ncbi:hypothetical protein AK830_g452 [Neonectria ditissima]|uniref:Helicase ATP-binding domain-containing protein n=1 Tax=Neonectria ditissima TaxID=78410 RepID=A0A0P7BY11_9HYPO|nr:hypothetical protein AK830_g452 [Neonectria ditissima]
MAPTAKKTASKTQNVHNYVSIDRIPGLQIKDWRCRTFPTHAHVPAQQTTKERSKLYEEWKELGYPPGILVAYKWVTSMEKTAQTVHYLNLGDTLTLASYTDCLHNTEEMLTSQSMPSPIEVIKNLINNPEINVFVQNVFKSCIRPTFIPTINKVVFANLDNMKPNDISKTTFILVHAIQILLFSPTDFDPSRKYTRDRNAYPHRFPTPPEAGGGDLKFFEDFTIEDVNRSIIAFYYLVVRREGRVNNLIGRKPPKSTDPFVGYADPSYKLGRAPLEGADLSVSIHTEGVLSFDAEQSRMIRKRAKEIKAAQLGADGRPALPPPPDKSPNAIIGLDAVDLHTEVMEAMGSTNLKETLKQKFEAKSASEVAPISHNDMDKVIYALKCKHGYENPDKVYAGVSKQVAHNPRISNGCLDFTERQKESDTQQNDANKYPGDINGLTNKMQEVFDLEMQMNVTHPVANPDLDLLGSKYGMAKYPKISFYPDSQHVQPLKPHQLVGTDMTRIYLSAIEMAVKLKEQAIRMGEKPQFKPVLILTSPNSITQTYSKVKKEFPSLHPKTYYTSPGTLSDKLAHFRTIIISTYSTYSLRHVIKKNESFVWKDGFEPEGKQRIDDYQEDDDKAEEADAEDGSNSRVAKRKSEIPRFLHYAFNCDEIDLLGKNNPLKADGNLVTYSLDSAVESYSFSWLIADDAHCRGDMFSSYYNLMRLLKWETLIWVSGTPMANSGRDLIAPLGLFWMSMKIDWTPDPETFPNAALMYDPNYDPYKEVWSKAKEGEEAAGKVLGIFHETYLKGHPELIPMEEAFRKDSYVRLWYLSAALYRIAGRQMSWGNDHARQVIRPIMEKMQIRRTMRSEVVLPGNLGKTTPTEGLLPATVCVEEVAFDEYGPLAEAVKREGIASSESLFAMPQARGQVSDGQASQSDLSSSKVGQLNFEVHRKAVMAAFDWRNQTILNQPTFYGEKSDISQRLQEAFTDKGLSELTEVTKADETSFGMRTEDVKQLFQTDTNGGLNYYYLLCRKDPAFLAPADRALFVRWMADESPILTRALELAHTYVNLDNERFLLYVDTPWLQAVTCAFFTLAGFNVATVRPSDKQSERSKIIDGWNRDSDLEILVVNVNTLSTSINIHKQCSKGAFLTWHLDAETMLQNIDRLVRIDQTKAVKFHLLKVKNSYYDNIERLCTQDWAAQLSAEVNFPHWLDGDLRECCVFEMIKTAWNQPFNRYVWVVSHVVDGPDFEYYSDKCMAIGHLMSRCAKLMMAARPDDEEFWKAQKGFLFDGLVKIYETSSTEGMPGFLEKTNDRLLQSVFPDVKAAFEGLDKEELASELKHKELAQKVKERNMAKSVESHIDSDSDDDTEADESDENDGSDEDV